MVLVVLCLSIASKRSTSKKETTSQQVQNEITNTDPTVPQIPVFIMGTRRLTGKEWEQYADNPNQWREYTNNPPTSIVKLLLEGSDREDKTFGAIYVNNPPPGIGRIGGIENLHQVTKGIWQKETTDGHLWIFDEVKSQWFDAEKLHRIYLYNGLRTFE